MLTLAFTGPTKPSELLEPQTSTDLPLEGEQEVLGMKTLWLGAIITNLPLLTATMIAGILEIVHIIFKEDFGTMPVLLPVSTSHM